MIKDRDREEDAPQRRSPDHGGGPRVGRAPPTVMERAVTTLHRSGNTDRLAEIVTPPDMPVVREPTELLSAAMFQDPDPTTHKVPSAPAMLRDPDGDTHKMPSAPEPTAGELDGPNRLHLVAQAMLGPIETLRVDRRPMLATFFVGICKGLVSEPTSGALERMGAYLAQQLLMADAGIYRNSVESQIGQALVRLSVDAIVGVERYRHAIDLLIQDIDAKAKEARARAKQAKQAGETGDERWWLVRAVEREDQLAELQRAVR